MTTPLIERRAIEADIFHSLYERMKPRLGEQQALSTVREAVEALAAKAGREFAATAPNGPSFGHFATVVDIWRNSGALEVADVQLSSGELRFNVTRCEYVERYRSMGLPEELVGLLSCSRDEPFARAYSPNVHLERPETLGNGGSCCRFRFTWST